jgi:hypothetical protein
MLLCKFPLVSVERLSQLVQSRKGLKRSQIGGAIKQPDISHAAQPCYQRPSHIHDIESDK